MFIIIYVCMKLAYDVHLNSSSDMNDVGYPISYFKLVDPFIRVGTYLQSYWLIAALSRAASLYHPFNGVHHVWSLWSMAVVRSVPYERWAFYRLRLLVNLCD